MSQQLRLLPAPKPLTDRFGAAFFRAIPRAPGVYRMFDNAGLLLYVGQSANLHDRLNSYRHVHPDRDSKKTIRMVHLVRQIEWEVCDSPVSAVLRENELLRRLRPRFNRMNVYPKACFFIASARENEGLRSTLTRDTNSPGKVFGAFKGAAMAFASICRLLFIASNDDVNFDHFPARLLTTAPLRVLSLGNNQPITLLVEEYLAGESAQLVELLTDVCAGVELRTPFEQSLMLGDLITTEEFFERGPRNVRRLREKVNTSSNWVEPELLVDFLAANRLEVEPAMDRIAP